MIKPRSALWRVIIAAIVSAVLLIMISNELSHPVKQITRTYNAEFTDVSGLMKGADVRVRGVRVGQVEDVALKRSDGGRSIATVRLTLDKRFGIVGPSRLAVRYQALTGLRYVDVQNPAEGDAAEHPMTHIPTTMTVPSFDITVLFNGLQPVLATLSPEEINTFTDNAISFLQGDGKGLGPMLDSIHKLTEFVSDRQQVMGTIVHNLASLADEVNGRSEYLSQFLDNLNIPFQGAMAVLDEFRKSQVAGADFTRAVIHLLSAAGVRPGIDTETALDRSITNVYSMLDVIKRTPVIWDNLPPPPADGSPVPCSKGRAQLPEAMDVLLNGQRVVLCNK